MLVVRSARTREALRSALAAAGVTVTSETDDVDAALSLHQTHRPDLLVVDVGPPHVSGLVATLEILTLDPRATVVACAEAATRERASACRRAGVAHFWLEPVDPEVVTRFVQTRLRARLGVGRAA